MRKRIDKVKQEIDQYIASQPEAKCRDMTELHARLLRLMPGCTVWFLDGKNGDGKIVSNPNIGYGVQKRNYADALTREFYQRGMSANTGGISIYILGLEDKAYLAETYGISIGKASVSGYCIKFKRLTDIDVNVLEAAVRDGIAATGAGVR